MTPIVDTLRQLAGDACRAVSYREAFRRLWAVDPSANGLQAVAEGLEREGVGTLAIVWDGPPHLDTGPVDTTRYLTPLDWVVALACELESVGDAPGFTVWILRLQWDRNRASETERFVESIPGGQIPGIPWAHLVRPTAGEDDENGPADLVAAVRRPPEFNRPTRADAPAPDALAPVRGAWTFALSRPRPDAGHHDLANLLGPQLLLEEAAVPDAAPLKQLVRSLGLYPQPALETQLTDAVADLLLPESGGGGELDGEPGAVGGGGRAAPVGGTRQDGEPRQGGNIQRDGEHGETVDTPQEGRHQPGDQPGADTPQEERHPKPGDRPRAATKAWFRDGDDEYHWDRRLAAAGEKTAVFLVDDMWRLGWGAVICSAFGASMDPDGPLADGFAAIGRSDRFDVFAADGPDPVIDALRGGADRRFAFSLRPGPPTSPRRGAHAELAVLDLRLFGGRSVAEEATFLQSLIEIARERAARGKLPWPRIDEDELARIDAWCRSAIAPNAGPVTRNDPAYLEGMTLLPRLVALADPAYPVIVFSSTGRRVIVEKLQPYGNLITAFEKPQVATLGNEDLAFRTVAGFRRALRDALDLLAVRRRCLALPAALAAKRNVAAAPVASDERWTVQVYLDESGDADLGGMMTVGGLAVVFPPNADRAQFDRNLWKTTDLRHLLQPDFDAFKKVLRKEIGTHAERIETSAGDADPAIRIAAVAVSGQSDIAADAEHEGDPLFDPMRDDNLHRELVRVVLEGAIYDVARQLVPDDASKVDLYVWLATRRTPLPTAYLPEERMKELKSKLRRQWGIECTERQRDGQEYALHMTASSARPLVEGVQQRYSQSTFRALGQTAVAVGLNRDGAHFLHYVADSLLSGPDRVPDVWWHRGFGRRARGREWSTRYDERLQALLKAQRHLLAGRTVEALAEGTGHGRGSNNSLELRIQHRLQEALPTLSGTDVLRLKALLGVAPREPAP